MTSVLFDTLISLVGCTVARLTLPFLSFGRICVEPVIAPLSKFNALGFRWDDNGRLEIAKTVAGFVGLLICLFAFFALGLLIQVAL
jgi:hypothetical protein